MFAVDTRKIKFLLKMRLSTEKFNLIRSFERVVWTFMNNLRKNFWLCQNGRRRAFFANQDLQHLTEMKEICNSLYSDTICKHSTEEVNEVYLCRNKCRENITEISQISKFTASKYLAVLNYLATGNGERELVLHVVVTCLISHLL